MVDVNNELVPSGDIVGALTGKNEKDKFYVLGVSKERGGSEKLGRGGKGNGWGEKEGEREQEI